MTTLPSESRKKRDRILAGSGIIIAIFIIYYAVMSVYAPSRKLEDLNTDYGFKQDEKGQPDPRIKTDSAYLALLKEKSYFQSRVQMAETDSIYLTMNLSDSVISLEISGVAVHKTIPSEIKISHILRAADDYTLYSMLSKPLTIVKEISSIEKEPLMIKMAPRDTSEYIPDIMPDTADFEPVNFILETDLGIKFYFYQDELIKKADKRHIFFFDLSDRLKTILASTKRVLSFKVPEYHPFVRVKIPRADAKIIYRALPVNGQLTVNW
jgi:hypothetical protein